MREVADALEIDWVGEKRTITEYQARRMVQTRTETQQNSGTCPTWGTTWTARETIPGLTQQTDWTPTVSPTWIGIVWNDWASMAHSALPVNMLYNTTANTILASFSRNVAEADARALMRFQDTTSDSDMPRSRTGIETQNLVIRRHT
jgi:hypothetical protein